jgi:two-component system, cell cycle response regulator CtrA
VPIAVPSGKFGKSFISRIPLYLSARTIRRQMRRARCDTPVLVLCGISHTAIKVRGLQACADDFVTKPFNRAELIARMQAVIRRTNSYHTQPRLSVGKLRPDLRTRQFTFDGQPIYLTVKENMILELLAFRQDTPVTRKELIEHLYGGIDEPKIQIGKCLYM